jgi:hypothetical protein
MFMVALWKLAYRVMLQGFQVYLFPCALRPRMNF